MNNNIDKLQTLNRTSLNERLMNDMEIIKEVLNVFLEDTPTLIEKIKTALAAGDLDGSCDAAHSLKGSAGSIGAEKLQENAKSIEYASRDKNAELARKFFSETDHLFSELKSEIQKILSRA